MGRCYVIAEAGSNHNRDWEIAVRLVETAAAAGADAVKFQLFRADRMYPRGAGTADYLEDPTDIHEIIARMELPDDWLPGLAAEAGARGLDFLVSGFDEEAVDAIDPFVPLHKIASYELTHLPLVRHAAAKAKPLLLSTGGGTIEEVEVAITAAREAGAAELVVLQCTASYPARLEALNVGAIVDLRERFDVAVGLSDHSADPVIAPVAATALGAVAIEKHFTLDRTLPGPDHRFALKPDDLRRMVESIREAEAAVGTGRKDVHPDEEPLRVFARRSVFTIRDIRAGEQLDRSAIAVLRSGKLGPGLAPSEYPRLLGARAARDLAANTPLAAEDVEAWPSRR